LLFNTLHTHYLLDSSPFHPTARYLLFGQYYVKWVGYDDSYNSWVDKISFKKAKEEKEKKDGSAKEKRGDEGEKEKEKDDKGTEEKEKGKAVVVEEVTLSEKRVEQTKTETEVTQHTKSLKKHIGWNVGQLW
jgi:hypothetical protein